jgi:hypothetical protein
MTAPAMTDAQDTSATYEVGYGKPPRHTQFRKGKSGNPGGRPRRLPVERANALLLAEAYRCVAIKEDGRMVPVTALQAILRSQVELAINGNYRAQRDVLKAVQHLEILKSVGAYAEETDDDDETDDVGESGEEDENSEGEDGEQDESGDAGETAESDEDDETGEGDETGSDGAVVTAAPDPAPLVDGGIAPPVFSAAPPQQPAPEASPQVPSTSPRPASPPTRRCRGHRRRPDRAAAGGTPSQPSVQRAAGWPRVNRAELGARIPHRRKTPEKFPVKFAVLRESAARRRVETLPINRALPG